LIVAVLAVAALVVYPLLPGSAERAVRDQIDTIVERLSAPAGEEPLARAGRLAALRSQLAPDVRVELQGEGISLRGTDEVIGFGMRTPVPAAGVVVETGDIEVDIRPDRLTADARFSARLLERRADGEPAILDARTVALTLVRHDQAWRVSSARIMPSDDAAAR
jgi:hypothetical protein